jgi:hypothetical protein
MSDKMQRVPRLGHLDYQCNQSCTRNPLHACISAFSALVKKRWVVHLTTQSCLRVPWYIAPTGKSTSAPIKCIRLPSLSRQGITLERLEMGVSREKSTTNVRMRRNLLRSRDIFCAGARRLELLLVSDEAPSQDGESWNDSRTPRREP